MKILFIAPQPFFRVRGTPINVRNVVETLGAEGHEVDLLCYPFGEDVDMPGVKIIRSPGFPGVQDVKVGPSAAKVPLDGLMFFKAWGLCRKKKYDVIHAVEESVFFAKWLARRYKTRLIYDMDSCISDQLEYSGTVKFKSIIKGIIKMEQGAIKQADFTLTVCEALSDMVRELVPDATIVQIEDAPLDDEFIANPEGAAALLKEFGVEGKRIALYTGNFEPYQGVELLLDAIPEVVSAFPEAFFLLVGGEPQQIEALKAQAIKNSIAASVVFTGKRPMEEMTAFMSGAEMLLSPRVKGTNTALKIYGYMQSGLPIVATDLETHTQVLNATNAYLTPANAKALSEGLTLALSNPEEATKRGLQSKQDVDEKYSLPRFRRQLIEAYRRFV